LIAVTWLDVSWLMVGTMSVDLVSAYVDPLSSLVVNDPSQRAS